MHVCSLNLICGRVQQRKFNWRSMRVLGEQKGQITWQAAEDALTFHCLFWSQMKGRGPGGGSSMPVVNWKHVTSLASPPFLPNLRLLPGVEWMSRKTVRLVDADRSGQPSWELPGIAYMFNHSLHGEVSASLDRCIYSSLTLEIWSEAKIWISFIVILI